MYKGVFCGARAKKRSKRILILGESHHWSAEDYLKTEKERSIKEESYRTDECVERYLRNYNTCTGKERDLSYRFFDNIVRAFDIDPELYRTDFWSRVYFGNYVDRLCGVRDSRATNLLKIAGKREELNRQLFEFIENNRIDIVFCFSRKVYDKLPPLEESLGDREEKGEKSDSHRLDACVYGAGERKAVPIPLSKSVTFYGLKHPSQGFSYRKYQCSLKNLLQCQMQ